MSLKLQERPKRQNEAASPSTEFGGAPAAAPSVGATERSVFVVHGVHYGHFPVAGLRIRDARETLTRVLNVHPDAVPVINGQPVSEDTIIGEQVRTLNFVQPSSIKGRCTAWA